MFFTSNTSSSTTSYGSSNAEWIVIHVAVPPPPPPPIPWEVIDALFEAVSWLELEFPLEGPEQVERARKRLARLYHPDMPGGDVVKMQAINRAADFLLGRGNP